jgi:hypothetical protein
MCFFNFAQLEKGVMFEDKEDETLILQVEL